MIDEVKLISSIVNNNDIASVINNTNVDELFDSCSDVWQFTRNYYYQYRSVVPKDVLEEKFPDFAIKETTGNVKHYLDQLRDSYQRSMLERIARGLTKDLDRLPTQEAIKAVERHLALITKASGNIKDLDITDHEKAVDHYIEVKKLMEENGGVLGSRFGYDSIDANYPPGKSAGQFIVLMSRTGHGKSWLALDFAINAWAQGKKVLYVSLEMPPALVRDRAYTLMSKGEFRMSDLSRAKIDIDQVTKWSEANLNKDKSFVVTSSDGLGSFSCNNLSAKIDQYAPDEVYVDYAQLMDDNKGSGGETDRVRSVFRELKSLTLSRGVCMFAIAAASSNETKEYNSPPQIYEVAQSKQSAFDADLVISMISKKQRDPDTQASILLTEVVARKNRHGEEFNFILRMDVNNGRIEEVWDDKYLEQTE